MVSTGKQTEVGKISNKLNQKQDKTTPLKRKLKKLSKILVLIAVVLCVIILGLQFFWAWKTQVKDCQDELARNATASPQPTTTPPVTNANGTVVNATVVQCKLTKHDIIDVIKVGISLAVSVIPEGLVAVVTITMALGVQRMGKKQVIVRNLPVIEGLGSITSVRGKRMRRGCVVHCRFISLLRSVPIRPAR